MEDLLRSLHNLGLQPPNVDQLWQLLDDDKEVQERLTKLLAFNAVIDEDDEDGAAAATSAAALMGQDLLQEAVAALLDNFRQSIKRQRELQQNENAALARQTAIGNEAAQQDGSTKKQKQKPLRLPPPKALVARQEAALRKREQEEQEDAASKSSKRYRPKLIYDGDIYHHSSRSLQSLQKITCAQLDQAPKRYADSVLIGKVSSKLLLYVGVTFLLRDQKGTLVPVSVSHFTDNVNLSTEQASALLPINTIVAIREPFVSLDHQSRAGPCSGKGNIGIRIDTPTDISVLQADDEVLQGVEWQDDDGDYMSDTRDPAASPTPEQLYQQGRFGAAYRAIALARRTSQPVDPLVEARVLFKLCAWREAQEKFEALASDNASRADEANDATEFAVPIERLSATQAARRSALRLAQSSQGLSVDDVRSIHFAASSVARFDTADFIGPLAVKSIDGEGRGLVCTRDIEPGELLLCCRAVAASYPDDVQCKGSPIVRLNLDSGVVSATSQVRAQTNLIHAIVDRPERAHAVLGLTAGPHIEYSEFAKMDHYPSTTEAILDAEVASQYESPLVDARYVDGVLRFNAFGPARGGSASKEGDEGDGVEGTGELAKSTMPHPLPAILNHACLPNVASIFFSDIVTSRALTRLEKGTQIVHQYVRGEEPYAIRQAQLSKHGFVCQCELCAADRADGQEALTQRARIIQGELGAVKERSRMLMKRVAMGEVGQIQLPDDEQDAHRDLIGSLAQFVQRVRQTYHSSRDAALRPDLFTVMQVMLKHVILVDAEEAQRVVIEAVSCVGGTLSIADEDIRLSHLPRLHMDGVIGMLLLLAVAHANKSDIRRSNGFMQTAFYAHQCMIGGGIDVFRDRWHVPENDVAFVNFVPSS